MNLGQSSIISQRTVNGNTLQILGYDQDGNLIKSKTSQTTVSYQGKAKESGLFYMRFKVKNSNTQNARLDNIRISESHPIQLTQALQGASAIKPTLNAGESNILEWDTANSCDIDANCGTPSEKCVYTASISPAGKYCLIDISNFIGNITFGLNITGDYKDAMGLNPKTTSTLINLPILFEQDQVIFRTNNLNYDSGWIAVDLNSDGILEGYDFSGSSGLLSSCDGGGRTLTGMLTPTTNYQVVKDSSGKPNICIPSGVKYVFKYFANPSSVAVILNTPQEPYTSNNCGGRSVIGNALCQERYSIQVAPPTQTCGNNAKEGTETCDGSDLDGKTCQTVPGSFTGGTLSCSGTCNDWVIDQCTPQPSGSNVMFRTYSLDYGNNNAVAYSSSCGSILTKYGKTTSSCVSVTMKCNDFSNANLMIPSNTENNGLWFISDYICICNSADIGKNLRPYKYTIQDSDATKVSDSATSINSSMEMSC